MELEWFMWEAKHQIYEKNLENMKKEIVPLKLSLKFQ